PGAVVYLKSALSRLARVHLAAGETAAAAELLDEDQLIAEATGNKPAGYALMALAAWRGQEPEATALIKATVQAAVAPGMGRLADVADYASAVLNNGLGRHDAARDAARRVFEHDPLGLRPGGGPELAEPPSRPRNPPGGRRGPVTQPWRGRRGPGCPTAPGAPPPTGRWGSRPAWPPCWARARTPSICPVNRSSVLAAPASGPSWPARTCSTGSG